MNPRDEKMADLLEQYLTELESDPDASPPAELDPQMAAAARRFDTHFDAPEPRPAFVSSLRDRLDREATTLYYADQKKTRGIFALPRWSYVGIGAVVLLAISALVLYATRPAPASAEQVLAQASSVANNLAAAGVTSFQLESESQSPILGDPQQPIAGMSDTITNLAYGGPTRWRNESTTDSLGETIQSLQVSDGATLWTYDALSNVVFADVATGQGLPLPNVGSLELLREDWSHCYTPQIVGRETIVGRAAYKIDLGENKCQSASLFKFEGTRTLWVDQQTFFILRDVFVGTDGKQNLGTYNVTKIQYNTDLSADLFQYTPPSGARLSDRRPKPAPNPEEYQAQLTELARNADFPLFAPSPYPQNLVPRVPQFEPIENNIKLEYVPPGEASTNTIADAQGVIIRQQRADDQTLHNWTDGSEQIDLNGTPGWIRRGGPDPNLNTGINSAVTLVRDGTLISLSSFGVSPDTLIEIAKTLAPIPGGHAPLPNPTAPALADFRSCSSSQLAL